MSLTDEGMDTEEPSVLDKFKDILRVEEHFLCPITREIMRDPVILVETGHSFDRNALEDWLEHHRTCPVTRTNLRNKSMVNNCLVRSMIKEKEQSTFASIQQIKFKLYDFYHNHDQLEELIDLMEPFLHVFVQDEDIQAWIVCAYGQLDRKDDVIKTLAELVNNVNESHQDWDKKTAFLSDVMSEFVTYDKKDLQSVLTLSLQLAELTESSDAFQLLIDSLSIAGWVKAAVVLIECGRLCFERGDRDRGARMLVDAYSIEKEEGIFSLVRHLLLENHCTDELDEVFGLRVRHLRESVKEKKNKWQKKYNNIVYKQDRKIKTLHKKIKRLEHKAVKNNL